MKTPISEYARSAFGPGRYLRRRLQETEEEIKETPTWHPNHQVLLEHREWLKQRLAEHAS